MTHVLLTGASSGIGESMAKHFGSLGWNLTLAARRESKLNAIAETIASETFIRPTDLSDPTVCAGLVSDAVDALGPIDILINNAGIQFVERAAGVSADRIDQIFNINLRSPLHLIHHVLPNMLERGSGTIVNVASMAGIIATPGMCHYNGTKAGLGAMSESLRVELEQTGVHVLSVFPGPVYSPMEAAARDKIVDSFLARHVPTGDPDVLAKMVERAIKNRSARIVYPRFYGLARYTRVMSQWFTDRFTPKLLPPGE